MTMLGEHERTGKALTLACFKKPSQHYPGEYEEEE
jgi:hypothetical protein